MRYFNIGLCAIFALIICVSATPLSGGQHLFGAKQCTWGPSYWCSNLSNAKNCRAVNHCIQTVWEKQAVPVDTDSICKICKDMVTQARDQLRSNETEEELKEVFEGSCNLIPIKLIKKECSKLADDFIPELIEALSSQMNPDQVCSVAGLCNNAKIDKLLLEAYAGALDDTYEEKPDQKAAVPKADDKRALSCGNCNQLSNHLMQKFEATNRDDMLENLLHLCGDLSSFSDACANIVLTYFNDIYDHMKQHLSADGICHLSGVCASKYHQHEEDLKVEPTEELVVFDSGNDDIPCELCQQLVHHLRDLLVANTTEAEFKQVMEGLCKQTKNFSAECLSIVDQYYHIIYESLVSNLDANGACFIIGVCPKGDSKTFDRPIMPLLPVFPPAKIEVTIEKLPRPTEHRKLLGQNEPKFTQDELQSMVLPIDHLMGAANPSMLVKNGELCTICEYFLHFVQETLATPATEDEIKTAVNTVCDKMPNGVRGQCHNFVDMYSEAVIALLIQGLDPRSICPIMQMCPKNVKDFEVFSPVKIDEQDKPTCPLCLFAVQQAQEKIRDDKSKSNIKRVLANLCSHVPNKLRSECTDFVQTYTNELVDMLITDFKPQEICVELKLCEKSGDSLDDFGLGSDESESDERTIDHSYFNEIYGGSDEMPLQISFGQDFDSVTPNCLICEEIVKEAEKRINKHTTKDDIKKALEQGCDRLKKTIRPKCHKYVDKYGDTIAELLLKELEPKLICREIGLCISSEQEDLEIDEALKYDVIALPKFDATLERLTGNDITVKDPPTCVLCEFVMTKLEIELKNKTEQDEIKRAIEGICDRMPKTISKSCDKFVEQYANAIISLIGSVPPKELCQKMMLCFAGLNKAVTDEVIECGVCHGASQALLPYLRAHTEPKSITAQDMASAACNNLPGKYYTICSEMISIYGISIMHLSEKPNLDESHICAQIGKCFDNEKSDLAFVKIMA